MKAAAVIWHVVLWLMCLAGAAWMASNAVANRYKVWRDGMAVYRLDNWTGKVTVRLECELYAETP